MAIEKILIVDNDMNTALNLQERLSSLGYEVIGIATTSEEALSKSSNLKPSLIMMNTQLRNDGDGIKTGELITSKNDIPIIYISSSAGRKTVQRAGSTGPFGYIVQPFEDSQLFVTIEVARIRYKSEIQLRESEQWLNGVLKSIGDGVIAVDNKGSVRFINSRAEKITSRSEAEAIGHPLFEVLTLIDESSGELLDLSSDFVNEARLRNTDSVINALMTSKEGKTIPLELNFNPIIDHKHNLQGLVLAFRDITARRQAVMQIKQQASRSEALVKVAEQLNSRLEFKELLDTVCTITNQVLNTSVTLIFLYEQKSNLFVEMSRKTGPDLPKTDGEPFRITFDHDILQAFLPVDNSAFTIPDVKSRREIPYRHLLRLLKIQSLALAPLLRNEEVIGILVCGSTGGERTFSGDELELLKGLAHHITIAISNASLFEQIRKGRERQRQLSKNIVDIQETERRRIARELHDQLGQALTGIQFMLESLKPQMIDHQISKITDLQNSVSEIIRDVKEMSLNLRPSMLDDLGLVPTINWHLDRFTKQTGIRVNFNSAKFPERFPAEIETTAYRIVQEALTNVARHAQISEVFVGLAESDDALWIEILDNGVGFDTSVSLNKPTSGLSGMMERADLAGGYLTINSYINQGTQIVAALPLKNQPLERRKNDRNSPPG